MSMSIIPTARSSRSVSRRVIPSQRSWPILREAIELYIETLSEQEIKEALSREILTASLEVKVA